MYMEEQKIREDARKIMDAALHAALPDTAVEKALAEMPDASGRLILVAAGKAAWQMAAAAYRILGERIDDGIVITKHGHAMGAIGNLTIREAGHPVPDADSYSATEAALTMTTGLKETDTVLFLLSGGGSALFEKPLIPPEELQDMIASGPAYPDSSTAEQARAVVKKYGLKLSAAALELLDRETPKQLDNVTTRITGSVRQLCAAASETCQTLGYTPVVLTASLACEAREAGAFLGAVAQYHQDSARSLAFIAGGETVVHLTGTGKGGRNQEIALAGAKLLDGLAGTALFSLGSDGTDGPTDAAGGIVTGETAGTLREAGVDIDRVLKDNDAYHALAKADGLIFTGPTGTNVNDLTVLLIRR